jgi:nicotinamide riboside kinase
MTLPQLICIIGAESTGKSTLTQALATHFKSASVPEYLREFCDAQQRTPHREEQINILSTQITHEHNALHHSAMQSLPFVFCDTAPLLTAIYSDYVFGDFSLYHRALIHHRKYFHTLLLLPDIDWVADGFQRDGDQVRVPITAMVRERLLAHGLPFSEVSGLGDARLANAVEIIDQITKNDSANDATSHGLKTHDSEAKFQ